MQDKELEHVEREAFRKFHEDGLFDMYLGALLGIMGSASWFADELGSGGLGMLAYAALVGGIIVAFTLARKRITRPRLGEFKPAPPRKRKILNTRLVLLGSVILGLLLFWAFADGGSRVGTLRAFMPAIWFANAMLVFGAMAYYLDIPRFYAYGVLVGLPLAIDTALEIYAEITLSPLMIFASVGLIVFGIGTYKFVHFLREYPVRATEVRYHDA